MPPKNTSELQKLHISALCMEPLRRSNECCREIVELLLLLVACVAAGFLPAIRVVCVTVASGSGPSPGMRSIVKLCTLNILIPPNLYKSLRPAQSLTALRSLVYQADIHTCEESS